MLSTTTFLLSKTFLLPQFSPPLQPMLSTTFLLSKTFLLSQFPPPLQPMLSTTTFLLSNTFLLSKISPPLCSPCFQWFRLPGVICDPTWLPFYQNFYPFADHAFNYIPFMKNIPFIKIFPPSAAHAFNYIPFIKNIPFIKIFPPLCSPCSQWYTLPGVICDLKLLDLKPKKPAVKKNAWIFYWTSQNQYAKFNANIWPLKIDCSKNNCPWPYTFEAGQRPCQANIITCLHKKHILRITWSELLCGVVVACDPTLKRPGDLLGGKESVTCDSSKAVGRVRRPRDYCTCHTKRT